MAIESHNLTHRQINLADVKRLCAALSEAMQPGYVGHWLDEPNEMLIGLKPVEDNSAAHIPNSTASRRTSATLQAWAGQPTIRCGSSAS